MKCGSYSVTAGRIPTREERFVLAQLRRQSAMTEKAMPWSCRQLQQELMARSYPSTSRNRELSKKQSLSQERWRCL